ncbi:hypothetical protein [Peribacillus glennii]|nr:hypothetical protein [Peribacillus glennii]
MATPKRLTDAAIQMNCKCGNKPFNLDHAYKLVVEAVNKGAN